MFHSRRALSLLLAIALAASAVFVFLPTQHVQAGSLNAPDLQTPAPPTITSTFPSYFSPGGNTTFTVTVTNPVGGAVHPSVRIYFAFSPAVAADITRFQFRDDKGIYYDMATEAGPAGTLIYYYGSDSTPAFVMPAPGGAPNTVYFRITWGGSVSKMMAANISLKEMPAGTILASTAVSYFVGAPPTLSSTLPASAGTNLPVEFPVTVTNGASGGTYTAVSTSATIANATAADFTTFQWYDGVTWQNATLTQNGPNLVAAFGPATFPLAPGQVVARTLRVQFATVRTYNFTFQLFDASQTPAVSLTTLAKTVVVHHMPTLTSTLPAEMGIYGLSSFSVTAANPADGLAYAGVKVKGTIYGVNAADITKLQVNVSSVWTDLVKTQVGSDVTFTLPAAGSDALAAAASLVYDLQIEFGKAGAHNVQFELLDQAVPPAATPMALWTGSFTVLSPSLSGGFPTVLPVEQVREFTVSASNPANGVAYSNARFDFTISNAVLADLSLEYLAAPSTWLPLPLTQSGTDVVGYFGPATGFPMPAPYSATTSFRVLFHTAKTYNYSIQLVNLVGETRNILTTLAGSSQAVDLPTISADIPANMGIYAWTNFTISMDNPLTGATYEKVGMRLEILNASAGDLVLQVSNGSGGWTNVSLTEGTNKLTAVVPGLIGVPVAPGQSIDLNMRILFTQTGDYNLYLILGDGSTHPLTSRLDEWDQDLAVTTPSLDGTIPARVAVGNPQTFTITATNPALSSAYSNARFNFTLYNASLVDDVDFIEYQVAPDTWLPLPLVQSGADVTGYFGPVDGFLMPAPYSATTTLRVQFKTAGDYSFDVQLVNLHDSTYDVLATLSDSILAVDLPTLSADIPANLGIYAWTEFTASLDNPLTGTTYDLVGLALEIANAGAGDAILQISDGAGGWTNIPLTEDEGSLVGTMPGVTGTPLEPGDSLDFNLRILFTQTGTYNFGMALGDGSDEPLLSQLAEWDQDVTVTAPSLSGVFPDLVAVDVSKTFTVTASNPALGSAYDHARFNILVAGAAPADLTLEYWDGAAFLPLPLTASGSDAVGYFGPVAGFPMGTGYSATTTFRVTFHDVGSYDFSIDLVNLHDSTFDVLDTLAGTVDAINLPAVSVTPLDPFVVGEVGEFSMHLVNPPSGTDYASVRYVLTLTGAAEGDITSFEYHDAEGWHTVTFSAVGDDLQAVIYPTGRDLPSPFDETYPLRIEFAQHGEYPFTLDIEDLDANPLSDPIASTSGTAYAWDRPVVNDQSFDVDENLAANTLVGTVAWTDADGDTAHTFALSDTSIFSIDAASGEIRTKSVLNFEALTDPVFTLTVTVTDPHGLADTATVTLTVKDVNEAPTVAHALTDQSVTTPDSFTYVVPANTFTDVDAGEILTWSAYEQGQAALPAWLSFDPATRTFSGTPSNLDLGEYIIVVKVTDHGGLTATAAFHLTVDQGQWYFYLPWISKY